jgi:hypothetical protein
VVEDRRRGRRFDRDARQNSSSEIFKKSAEPVFDPHRSADRTDAYPIRTDASRSGSYRSPSTAPCEARPARNHGGWCLQSVEA